MRGEVSRGTRVWRATVDPRSISPSAEGPMFKRIDFWAKRVVAYPLLFVGLALTSIARELIVLGAWLTDNEDLCEEK